MEDSEQAEVAQQDCSFWKKERKKEVEIESTLG